MQVRFQGGARGWPRSPSEISALHCAPPPKKKSSIYIVITKIVSIHFTSYFATAEVIKLGIRTESLLYISCHFNAFMFCSNQARSQDFSLGGGYRYCPIVVY